jgi:hypothetical protein
MEINALDFKVCNLCCVNEFKKSVRTAQGTNMCFVKISVNISWNT